MCTLDGILYSVAKTEDNAHIGLKVFHPLYTPVLRHVAQSRV